MHAWRRSEAGVAIVLFLPALGFIFLLKGVPAVQGLFASLTFRGEWVGIENYERMLRDAVWIGSLINAAKGLLLLPIFIILPLLLAYPIFAKMPGWRFFRAAFFIPHVLPAAMVGIMFTIVLSSRGPVVGLLNGIGLEELAVPFLARTETSLWALYAVVLWAWFGLGVLIYLGGLAAIDRDLFDAALVDGAGFGSMLRNIVVPLVLPTMAYWAVVCTSGLLLWLFPFVYSLTGGGPGYSSMLPEFYIYRTFLEADPGYASALGFTLFLLVAVVSLFQIRLLYARETT